MWFAVFFKLVTLINPVQLKHGSASREKEYWGLNTRISSRALQTISHKYIQIFASIVVDTNIWLRSATYNYHQTLWIKWSWRWCTYLLGILIAWKRSNGIWPVVSEWVVKAIAFGTPPPTLERSYGQIGTKGCRKSSTKKFWTFGGYHAN